MVEEGASARGGPVPSRLEGCESSPRPRLSRPARSLSAGGPPPTGPARWADRSKSALRDQVMPRDRLEAFSRRPPRTQVPRPCGTPRRMRGVHLRTVAHRRRPTPTHRVRTAPPAIARGRPLPTRPRAGGSPLQRPVHRRREPLHSVPWTRSNRALLTGASRAAPSERSARQPGACLAGSPHRLRVIPQGSGRPDGRAPTPVPSGDRSQHRRCSRIGRGRRGGWMRHGEAFECASHKDALTRSACREPLRRARHEERPLRLWTFLVPGDQERFTSTTPTLRLPRRRTRKRPCRRSSTVGAASSERTLALLR